jgi:hypothetical protein
MIGGSKIDIDIAIALHPNVAESAEIQAPPPSP